jgi:hypothetical protein
MMFPPWVKRYWKLYGGWRAILRSHYIYAALIFTFVCYPLWRPGAGTDWADASENILPNLMGFSIAGMAIMLAFSHPQSLRAVTQKGKDDSYFLKVSANLVHFLVVQVIAIFTAIAGKPLGCWPVAFFGVFTLLYAILLGIAAAGQLFNTARIMNTAAWLTEKSQSENDDDGD